MLIWITIIGTIWYITKAWTCLNTCIETVLSNYLHVIIGFVITKSSFIRYQVTLCKYLTV